ncbi:hypothetical protein Tco_0682754 [Tanacetum coccineum]|uniref:Uncharacterized protein n=1 Tax=Tanacetum coccineum TaxID=301880 RepID=A0ABQ4XS95_9ASTR
MESSSSNSEERELQQMQMEERELHQKLLGMCLEFLRYAVLVEVNTVYWGFLGVGTTHGYAVSSLMDTAYRIENLHSSNPKSCLDILRTPFKEFFDSKEVNALNFHDKFWQKNFKDYTGWEPKTYKRILLWYLEELDNLIDEKVLKYGKLWMKETEVQAIKEIEKRLQESCLVTGGIELDDSLVAKESTNDSVTSSKQLNESSSSHNESNNSRNEIRSYDNEISSLDGNDVDADTGHSYDSNTVTDVPYSNNNTFKNVFAHGIQNHKQPKSFPDTYVVNENNSNIISNIPNMDKDRVKEEHDCVAYEQ